WISASEIGIRGGQPSTTQPIAGPWLSPQVVTRKRCPRVLCDIGATCRRVAPRASNSDRQHAVGGKQHDAVLRRRKMRCVLRLEPGEEVEQRAQDAAMRDDESRAVERR